jgi:hypothetical protein
MASKKKRAAPKPWQLAAVEVVNAARAKLPEILDGLDHARELKEDKELRKYFIGAIAPMCLRIYPSHAAVQKAVEHGTDLAWAFIVNEERIAADESGETAPPKKRAKKPASKRRRK